MRLLTTLLLSLLAWAPAWGTPTIWSAVILATNEKPPKPVPEALAEFAPTLRRVFGYNSFYLLGEKTKEVRPGAEEWLVPSRRIFMKVGVSEAGGERCRLRTEFYDGKKLLVTAEADLAEDEPLYIRGPAWGRGQIVALLELR